MSSLYKNISHLGEEINKGKSNNSYMSVGSVPAFLHKNLLNNILSLSHCHFLRLFEFPEDRFWLVLFSHKLATFPVLCSVLSRREPVIFYEHVFAMFSCYVCILLVLMI